MDILIARQTQNKTLRISYGFCVKMTSLKVISLMLSCNIINRSTQHSLKP